MKKSLVYSSLVAFLITAGLSHGQTGWNQTAGGTYDYNDPGNWVDFSINGIWDSTLNIPSSQTITFGANTVLTTGLSFEYLGSANETFRGTGGDFTLTLGGDILHNTSSSSRTINFGSSSANQALNVNLGGVTRTFTVGSGRSLGFVNTISNGGLIISGGTINFSGSNTYTGATTVTSGVLSLNGANGSSAQSDITVNANGNSSTSVTFKSDSGSGTTRAKSVSLNGVGGNAGAQLLVTGNSGLNTDDVITNAITGVEGYAIIGVSANASKNARLSAGSFVRDAGSTVLFRGSNLGTTSIASQTAGNANITFGTAPTLSGAGSVNTTTVGIIAGAYGDTVSNLDGRNGGLVTYDSTYGVRLLNGSEYTAGLIDGQTQLDNVQYARAAGDPSQDINLTSGTTSINSLSFKITGVAGSGAGVTISGDAGSTLTLNSGAIFASQQLTGASNTFVAGDAMTISVETLNLNGKEGVINVFTNGINNGNTAAPLYISSAITNDGGNGVTFGGTGETILSGSAMNTYTGVTTLNSGYLRLDKTGAATATTLNTDLIMNGGTLLKRSNSIADTASVTLNGGLFVMDNTTSSGNNGHAETVENFTMNGGSFSNHGSNASFTANGNLTLNASQFGMNAGGDITVSGSTILNGGVLLAREASNATFNAVTTLNTVSIVNQATDSYTAMILNSHATNNGALVTLNGDLTFTGNGTNTQTVFIDSSNSALANQGVIALNGARTFDIGNGAAAVDLTINPAIVDSTVGDSLVKTGSGTLLLAGANTYTGSTAVNAGTLLINGSSASAVTVNGGVFGGTGTVANSVSVGTNGTLAPGNSAGMIHTGDLSLTGPGAMIAMEIAGTGIGQYDQINVAGAVSLNGNGQISLSLLSYTPVANDLFFLVLNDSNDAISGTLFGLAQGATFDAAGYTWQVSYLGDSTTNTFSTPGGNDLALQVVPEPATWVLLAGGLSMLVAFRRRRAV